MAKADDFLNVSNSEDDNIEDYSSDNEVKKGASRSVKRRKLSDDEDNQSDVAEDEAEEENETSKTDELSKRDKTSQHEKSNQALPNLELPDITRSLTKKNLVVTEAAIKKSGVVYMSRIPPFMKPAKLRSLLEPYGAINRIFLAPEDPTAHARRVRSGGNKKRSYTEGWVEFVKKKEAKAVCELLNARIIGGKKGSYYHDDIWNLLYLKGFKWHNLTEQIAGENAERSSRMRAEISKTAKENKEFVRNVERAKMLDGMQAKSKKRKVSAGDEDMERPGGERLRSFKQIPLAKKAKDNDEPSEQVSRVLGKIF